MTDPEHHRSKRSGWLRAAVLGANDGIVSTASLIIGVAAAGASSAQILLAGLAGLVAGAMSMAAGEYVSVSSQADIEKADLELEKDALENNYTAEVKELAHIYENRGLQPALAHNVAEQLMEHDALGAHARDEIGISHVVTAQPVLAAASSGTAFTVGAAVPLMVAWLSTVDVVITLVASVSLVSLATLGALAARVGGAPIVRGTLRVTLWGATAMAITAGVGRLFGVAV